MTSEDGEPLTQLRLIKPTWQRVKKFSKEKCIQQLCLASKLKTTDLEVIGELNGQVSGVCKFYNITIEKNNANGITLTSQGGDSFSEPAIRNIKTVTRITYPELWDNVGEQHDEADGDRSKGRKKKLVGLRESEKNLVHLLNTDIVNALEEELDNGDPDGETNDNGLEENDKSEQLLRMALRHSDISLLNEILEDLRENNSKKWLDVTTDDLYPRILTNAAQLNKHCTIPELQLIAKVLEYKTGRKFFTSSAPKASNINIITKAFGGEVFLELQPRKDGTKKKVKNLQSLCKAILLSDEYNVKQLQVSLANAIHVEKKKVDEKLQN